MCAWFIWQGAIFRVFVSTLQLPREEGGWALTNIVAKCKTLLYAPIWFSFKKNSSITTRLKRKWCLNGPIANDPNVHGLPTGVSHIRYSALVMTYVTPPGPQETMQMFKTHLYGLLLTMATRVKEISEMRITCKYQEIAWRPVWANVHTIGNSNSINLTKCTAIHEIIPTFGCNSSHHYNVRRAMRRNIYTAASTDWLRGSTRDMDLDKNQDNGVTKHKPETLKRGLDRTHYFPLLAFPKSGG